MNDKQEPALAIDYHWNQFKVKSSALPMSTLRDKLVVSGTKPRQGEDTPLWKEMLLAGPMNRETFVL